MTVTHDDRPHPVPPIAYLRYKENWFFLIFDPENDVFGATHIVSEPGMDRISFACHLSVRGTYFAHGNVLPFPKDFAMAPELGDGALTVRFVEPHQRIELALHNDDVDLDVAFTARSPLFNFDDYHHANPDKVGVPEVTNFGTNLQNVHQQQAMRTQGTLSLKSGERFEINALGYRDHSRSVRSDNMVLKHFWTGLHFGNHTFGAMQVTGRMRPTLPGLGGYVHDPEKGLRALRDVSIVGSGEGPGGVPALVEFTLTDIYGEAFDITADLTERHAFVPLHVEQAGPMPFIYEIVENFAKLHLEQTGEEGVGLIEVGWSVDV